LKHPRFVSIKWKKADEEYFRKYGERITSTEYGFLKLVHFFTIFYDKKDCYLNSFLTGFAGTKRVKDIKEGKMLAKKQLKLFSEKFLRQKIRRKRG